MMQRERDIAQEEPRPSLAPLIAGLIAALALGVTALLVDPRTLLLVAAVLVVGLVGVRHPFAAVWVYLFVAVLRPEELGLGPAVLHLQLILAIYCVLAVFVLPTVFGRPLRFRFNSIDATTIPLFIVPLLVAPAAFWRSMAFSSAYDFSKNAFGYAIARVHTQTLRHVRLLFWCFALATGAMAIIGVRQWASGSLVVGEGGILRLAGVGTSWGDANSLANVLVTGLPILACLYWTSRSALIRLALVALAAAHGAAVVVTGSRSAALSLLAAALLIAWRSPRRVRTMIAVALGLIGLWLFTGESLRVRYLSVGHYWQETTFQQRADSRRVGWQMLLDHPFTGVGLGCFGPARREHYDGSSLNAHNVYAQVLGELGLPGGIALMFYVGGLWYGIRTLRRKLREHAGASHHDDLRHTANAIEALVVVLLVQGMAAHNLLRFVYFPLPAVIVTLLAVVDHPDGPGAGSPAPAVETDSASWHPGSAP